MNELLIRIENEEFKAKFFNPLITKEKHLELLEDLKVTAQKQEEAVEERLKEAYDEAWNESKHDVYSEISKKLKSLEDKIEAMIKEKKLNGEKDEIKKIISSLNDLLLEFEDL